ncbi:MULTISPECIES: hybrid sensor histidine kinase/response regulator [unclassified Nostoc]|uniref:hybrid sensor histidine kinase/response regulator n=1 Tax=unclassified Nostoc TaxID=2593658 RepID=UPI000B95AC81|nr:ATP-binding protein [Nostoc sp. 'Peltigera membranacea cyanobiont' 232]OYE04354.1 hybrid sensor histidine kinase/response regulator [Nostoc sp. 'Peltigera membranacea cyanobiont' 232]
MEKPIIHILLVEDSPSDAHLLRRICFHADREQWQMLHVERLSEAIYASRENSASTVDDSQIESRKQRRFDLVLLDLSLPDSIGLDTLKEFRGAVPDIPVVVLTGLDDEDLAMQALAEGAQDYLVKDQITIQQLVRAIRYAIERSEILNQLRDSEERTRQALAKEQELNELKSNFVAMVSHEFRTPMTTIRTAVDILEYNSEKLTDDRRTKYFDRIQNAINQMLNLLDEILFLSKTEAAKLEYKPTFLDLEKFCIELTDILQVNAGSQHSIIFTFQGESTQAQMDEDLLNCIFTNLISNAIKYSPPNNTIWFDLICKDGLATFQVRDRGMGIPLKDQICLFQTFYRASNVGVIQGTGLGLTIVKKCVELHGGHVQLESEENVGTTVIVTLPLQWLGG